MTKTPPDDGARAGIGATPSAVEIAAESDPKRKAVLGAISRIVEQRPLHIEIGDVTKKALAIEAGVSRQSLYERHADLWERFEFLRESALQVTPRERELEQELEVARADLATLRRQKDEATETAKLARQMADVFARTIAVLQEENRAAMEEVARLSRKAGQSPDLNDDATVIVMPSARRHPRP